MCDLSRPRSVLAPLLAASLLLLILFVFAGEWPRIQSAILNAQFGWVVAAVCISGFIFPLWSWQWQLLVLDGFQPSRREMSAIVASNSIVSSFLAPGAGAAVAAVTLVEKGVRGSAIASLLLADQIATAVVKLLVIALAVLLAPVPPALFEASSVLASAVGLFAVGVVLLCSGPWLSMLAVPVWRPVRTLVRFTAAVSRGLAAIGEARRAALVLALSLAKKGLEWTIVVTVQFACGMGFDPKLALTVMAAASISTIVPVAGGVGLLAAGAAGAYLLMGVETSTAIAAGILISIVDLPAAFGFVALGHLRRSSLPGTKP